MGVVLLPVIVLLVAYIAIDLDTEELGNKTVLYNHTNTSSNWDGIPGNNTVLMLLIPNMVLLQNLIHNGL